MRDAASALREIAAVWNSRDVGRLDDLFAEDARFEDVAFGVVRHGLDEIRELFRATWEGIPDLRTELTGLVSDGDRAASEWTLTGTHAGDFPDFPASGRSLEIRGMSIVRTRRGKVVSQRDYYDRASFLEQLGALGRG